MRGRNATGRTVSLLNASSSTSSPSTQYPATQDMSVEKQKQKQKQKLSGSQTATCALPRLGAPDLTPPRGSRNCRLSTTVTGDAYVHPATPVGDDLPSFSTAANQAHTTLHLQAEFLKRHPCRHRVSHGCLKTFSTSGHAARHAKIHIAGGEIRCSFAGCRKKFNRLDNMQQHLRVHNKNRSNHKAQHKYKHQAIS